MTTINADQYREKQLLAQSDMLFNHGKPIHEYLEEQEHFMYGNTICYIADELVYGALGCSPEIPYGIAYNHALDYIILNKVTRDLPSNLLDAVLQHELGHKSLGHEEISHENELEADAYSQARTGNMLAALIDMREKLVVPLSAVYPHQISVAQFDSRIAALSVYHIWE